MAAPHRYIIMVMVTVVMAAAASTLQQPSAPATTITLKQPIVEKNQTLLIINPNNTEEIVSPHINHGDSSRIKSASREHLSSYESHLLEEEADMDVLEVSQGSPVVLSDLRKGKKLHNSSELCWSNRSITPQDCSMFFHNNYMVEINSSSPCYFRCHYNPEKGPLSPLRLQVHLHYQHPLDHPTFITAQQMYNFTAWTLPKSFFPLGEDQTYTSLELTLCPPWSWHEGDETVTVRLTTSSDDTVKMQVSLSKDQNFELKKGLNESITATPASPWYKLYRWEEGEQSVLVTADMRGKKNDDVCAMLKLQNAQCPVGITPQAEPGRYQTFTERGGMVAHRDHYPRGLYIIVLPFPDNDLCTRSSSGIRNRTSRTKTVVLEVYHHATIWSNWYIFALTGLMVAGAVGAITLMAHFLINRTLGAKLSEEDRQQLLEESVDSSTSRVYQMDCGAAYIANQSLGSGGGGEEEEEREAIGEEGLRYRGVGAESMIQLPAPSGSGPVVPYLPQNEEDVVTAGGGDHVPYPPLATYAPHVSLCSFTETFNPQCVLWWKRVAVFERQTAEAQVSEVGFHNSMIIMAVFAALPTSELLRSYLTIMMAHGSEDQCYFNSRCLTAFGKLPAFAGVFTNIGYLLTGGAFMIIVNTHQKLTHTIFGKFNAKNSVGVNHHYGLYWSVGCGLIIQGIMSGLYHICPNGVTIRFDMMFMYVMLAVCVVCVWGLRHGDVTHHIYPTTVAVGVALMLAELREWVSWGTFWGILAVFYCIVLFSNAVLMARCGIWSFSPYKLWRIWQGWSPVLQKLNAVVKQEDRTSTPLQVVRVMVGLVANLVLLAWGIGIDPNIYAFILVVCLVNTALYFLNYIITKRLGYKEQGTRLTWVCVTVSLVLWIPALVMYYLHSSNSEASPSTSRALNSPCVLLGVYDYHDLWHIFSAFGLFFFFIGLLTMDDDLCYISSSKIAVF